MTASVISFFSIFDSINLNQISCQNEQDAKCADAEPISIAFVSEFDNIASEIVTHCFHSLPDIATHFFRQGSQLLAGFLADLNSISHCRHSSASLACWQVCSRFSKSDLPHQRSKARIGLKAF